LLTRIENKCGGAFGMLLPQRFDLVVHGFHSATLLRKTLNSAFLP
jgi:hypothetical protein